MQHHLAILIQPWLDLILDGKKTIEADSPKSDVHPTAKLILVISFT